MERVSLTVVGVFLSLAPLETTLAAPVAPVAASKPGAAPSLPTASKPSPPVRNLTKTRPGSVLKSDKLLPGLVDLRSDAERARDAELRNHFSRLAELDVMAQVAIDRGDTQLEEHVEQVRRKEEQRHQKVMIAVKHTIAEAHPEAAEGQP